MSGSCPASAGGARASRRWPRTCRTRFGAWAACRSSPAAGCGGPAAPHGARTVCQRPTATSIPTRPWMSPGATRRSAATTGSSPAATIPAPLLQVRAHENGAVESHNGHLETALDQALILRGGRDFATVDDYRRFVDQLVGRRNRRREDRIVAEMAALRPLPARRTTDFTELVARVTRTGGFLVHQVFYSAPAQLIGPRALLAAAGSPLRRSHRGMARRNPRAQPPSQAWAQGPSPRPRHRLSPAAGPRGPRTPRQCHPCAQAQATGAGRLHLPRRALPRHRLRPNDPSRGLATAVVGVATKRCLPPHGRPLGVGPRRGLRDRARQAHRPGPGNGDLAADRLPDARQLRGHLQRHEPELPVDVPVVLTALASFDGLLAARS